MSEKRPSENVGIPTHLLRQIQATRPDEIGCNECFELLDIFADLVDAGHEAELIMPLIQHHINMCRDCREEFQALMASLAAEADPPNNGSD